MDNTDLNPSVPQLGTDLHSFLEEVLLRRRNVHFHLIRADLHLAGL